MRYLLPVLIFLFSQASTQDQKVDWKKVKVLLYTKNEVGNDKEGKPLYIHKNIPATRECFQKLGQQNAFQIEVSDNPAVFTEENLKQYSILIFSSTNNDVFDTDEQRLAFRHFVEAGGGFVGIHSVVGTERNWTWFKMMLGGTFAWHPKFQKYKLQVIDPEHPSMVGLPRVWEKEDECYFQKELYPGIRPVLAHDLTSLNAAEAEKIKANAGPYTNYYPAAWYHQFDGGTIWITALGHDKKDYEDPIFIQHVFQGLKFVAAEIQKKDYGKAYSKGKDDAIQF